MLGILLLTVLLALATGTAVYLHSILVDVIANSLVRQAVSGLCFLAICIGLPWLLASSLFGEMYPTTTHNFKENEAYSYTQQPYGFVTTSSQGYDLVIYQNRTFWLNKEIGTIRLECAGSEAISANIIQSTNNYNRLIVQADNITALDTLMSFDQAFFLKRSILN
jgi:hypothetical protein